MGGEKQVRLLDQRLVSVDGFHEPTKTVYEFNGCTYHACPKCHPLRRNKSRFCHPDRTCEEVYEATLKKIDALKAAGYQVKVMWECDYMAQRTTNATLSTFLQTYQTVPPLDPRDAFFGGRTEAITLYATAEEGERISYIDFCSLYPSINKYGIYCTGFPSIIYQPEDQDISHYFGIAKVSILAPEHLFLPVLPVRQHGKLTFPLCSACVTDELKKPMHERSNCCGHSRDERMLHGTWVTLEIQQAVEKGYEIQRIHEVFHFPENQRKEGLFAEYVNTFLRVKQESSGWPEDCVTDEEKAAYVNEYDRVEGIKLTNVADNPGRKAIAKLLLNR